MTLLKNSLPLLIKYQALVHSGSICMSLLYADGFILTGVLLTGSIHWAQLGLHHSWILYRGRN